MNNRSQKITEALNHNDLCLLERAIHDGENVNEKIEDDFGNLLTPLSVASMLGHTDLLRKLLASGGEPNRLNGDGTTALSWAPTSTVAAILIESGARVEAEQPSNGCTSVHWASQRGQLELLKTLVEADGNRVFACPDYMANSPLGCAAMAGNLEVVQFLLESGHDPNISFDTPPSMSPLQWAIDKGHVKVIELLVQSGADKNLARGLSPSPAEMLGDLESS